MKKLLLLFALSASIYGKAQSCGVVFTSGPNALGTGGGYDTYIQNCLSYNADLNTVLWTHRASPYWNFSGNTSGSIQTTWLNVGTNLWDSMIIYRDSANTNGARYPGGTIFNPSGNTNIANAFMVGSGPTYNGTAWTGAWYSSRKPTGNYHTVTSVQNDSGFCLSGQAPFGNITTNNNYGGPNADMQQVGNKVLVAGSLYDITYTAIDNMPAKGAVIGKAVYSGGNLTWSHDSIIPNFYAGPLGYLTLEMPRIAFAPDGQTGYVVFIGRLAVNYGNNSADSSLSPIVYKTTNGGTTWSSTPILPGFDWATGHPEMLKNVGCLLNKSPTCFMPFAEHGIDVTVDSIGTLHLVAAVTNPFYSVAGGIDSIAAYGNQYQWDYKNHHPIIWDMMTDGTTWNTVLVDSIKTSFMPDGVEHSDTIFNNNPWNNGSITSSSILAYGARIQISRSVTGGKIFYSWTDSDSTLTHTLYNTKPDIYMKSYDISNQLVTPTSNVTSGIGQCYFHYLSDVSYYDNNVGGWVCPLVYTTDAVKTTAPFSLSDAVHYNYLNCAQFYTSQYNTAASVYRTQGPAGIANYTNNNNLLVYPNPANNKIVVDATEINEVKVFDLLGKQITSTKANEIDASNLPNGVYFIQVQTNQNSYTQKIIVQH